MDYEMDDKLYPFDTNGLVSEEISTLQWTEIPEKITYKREHPYADILFIFDHAMVSNGDVIAWYYKNLDNRRIRIMIMND